MNIYIIDVSPEVVRAYPELLVLQRAIVVAKDADEARCVLNSACRGGANHSTYLDLGILPRVQDQPLFDEDASTIIRIGETSWEVSQRSRVLAWELIPPRIPAIEP